jgi:hypothetical protein
MEERDSNVELTCDTFLKGRGSVASPPIFAVLIILPVFT